MFVLYNLHSFHICRLTVIDIPPHTKQMRRKGTKVSFDRRSIKVADMSKIRRWPLRGFNSGQGLAPSGESSLTIFTRLAFFTTRLWSPVARGAVIRTRLGQGNEQGVGRRRFLGIACYWSCGRCCTRTSTTWSSQRRRRFGRQGELHGQT